MSQATTPPAAELARLEARLGYRFRDRSLLRLALTHRSYAFEAGGIPTNERLEFLGDAVLGLVITDFIYRRFPDEAEGWLAKLRAAVVNTSALARVGRSLGLGHAVLLGRGEEQSGGRDKDSILADTLEAAIGAVYLDGGMAPSRALLETAARLRLEQQWRVWRQAKGFPTAMVLPLVACVLPAALIVGLGPW